MVVCVGLVVGSTHARQLAQLAPINSSPPPPPLRAVTAHHHHHHHHHPADAGSHLARARRGLPHRRRHHKVRRAQRAAAARAAAADRRGAGDGGGGRQHPGVRGAGCWAGQPPTWESCVQAAVPGTHGGRLECKRMSSTLPCRVPFCPVCLPRTRLPQPRHSTVARRPLPRALLRRWWRWRL